ncbi:MAG: hypothetical protein IJS61_04610 [Firmicutes bacterium]|nr:hypothetical protein [Bacillota bacterium]
MPKSLKGFAVVFVIALIFEIFVCNIRYFESIANTPTPAKVTGVGKGLKSTGEDTYHMISDEDASLVFSFDKTNVRTLYADLSFSSAKRAFVTFYANDAGNKIPYKLGKREIAQDVERSKYIKFNTAGATSQIILEFNKIPTYDLSMARTENEDIAYDFSLKDIVLNGKVPFYFLPVRFCTVLTLLLLLYAFAYNTKIYGKKLEQKNKKQISITLFVIALNILFALFIYFNNKHFFVHDRYVYPNLSKALLQGHFDLPFFKADERLLQMANPYDTTYRAIATKNNFHWDYAFYKGKYYVYFGIVPALLLFLPAKAFFNADLHGNFGVLVFMMIYIPIAFKFIHTLFKKYFKNSSFALFILTAQTFVFCSALNYLSMRNDLYAIPILTGLLFSVLGLDMWLSGTDEKGHIKNGVKLILGSFFVALTAGCRPQFLVTAFFALPIFFKNFKERELFTLKGKGKTFLFLLPFMIVGALLMYYNYARFGSPFDFGANYNLTTNDMTVRGFKLDRLPYGIYACLFQPLNIKSTFPFIAFCPPDSSYMGVFIYETLYGGAFATLPFTLICFALYFKDTRKALKNKGIFPFTLLCLVFALVIICADVNMAGLVARYMCDFLWLIMLAAILIFLTLEEKAKEKKLLRFAFSYGCIFALIINVLIAFVRFKNYGMDSSNTTLFYNIMYALQFWM